MLRGGLLFFLFWAQVSAWAALPRRVEGDTTIYTVGEHHELRITGTVVTFGSTELIDDGNGGRMPEVVRMHGEDRALQTVAKLGPKPLILGAHGPDIGASSPLNTEGILAAVDAHFAKANPQNPRPFDVIFLTVCHSARNSPNAAGAKVATHFQLPTYASTGHFQFTPANETQMASVQVHESGTPTPLGYQIVRYSAEGEPDLLEDPTKLIPDVPWKVRDSQGSRREVWQHHDSGSNELKDGPPQRRIDAPQGINAPKFHRSLAFQQPCTGAAYDLIRNAAAREKRF